MPASAGFPDPAGRFYRHVFGGPLDESVNPNKNDGLAVAQNIIYRPYNAISKRPGVSLYGGTGVIGSGLPVKSGVRWYRGKPGALKQMVVHSGDQLFAGNDNDGTFAPIDSFAIGSSPAFFASCYDPAESGVGGSPASDVLIAAYGSGPPRKYDGTISSQLSPAITNKFTGCHFWHEHVWFWGDPANPDTLFATDLGNPEAFTYMNTFVPPGYQIGRGDGDATIQRVISNGATNYVFKSRSIYKISGFDFFAGEYAFAVEPHCESLGTNSPHSVARLRNTLYFWSGQNFFRMPSGSTEPEPIGTTLVNTMAQAAVYSQSLIKSCAGDFLYNTVFGQSTLTNVYMVSFDSTGSGKQDTVIMFDEDASAALGKPCWSVFKGLSIGAFIPWGGPGDQKALFYGDGGAGQVNLFGGNSTADNSAVAIVNPIRTVFTTGRLDMQNPDQDKLLSRAYMEVDGNAATFEMQISSERTQSQPIIFNTVGQKGGSLVGTAKVGTAILGSQIGTTYQSIIGDVHRIVRGKNFQFSFVESSATSAWSLQGLTLYVIDESYRR